MRQEDLRRIDTFPASRSELDVGRKPDDVAGSTWDAYLWLRKHQPARLAMWLDLHPEVPR